MAGQVRVALLSVIVVCFLVHQSSAAPTIVVRTASDFLSIGVDCILGENRESAEGDT